MPVVCSKPVERSVELDDVRPKQHIISDLEDHDEELREVHVTWRTNSAWSLLIEIIDLYCCCFFLVLLHFTFKDIKKYDF